MFDKMCRIFQILFLGLVFIFLSAGCTRLEEPQEIVIGVVWPFEANNDLFNEGIDLAVKEINSGGGVNGKELKLLKEDDNSEVVKGISIAESLAENKSVRAVIGHRNSFVSLPASAIYEQAGLPMLSPASTDPELTRNHYCYIFRSLPSDDEIARKLAEYMGGQGLRRMVVYYSADAYGTGLANSFEDQAKQNGITIVDCFNNYSGIEELKRLRSRWQAFGYDGVFIAASMPGGAQFIHDAGQAGIKGTFATGDALDSPQLTVIGGKAADGTVVGSEFNPGSDRQEVQRFVQDFQETYHEKPNSDAALGYDAVRMLAAAMQKNGKEDRASIAEGLRNLGKWPGVCGVHELSAEGDDLGDLVVLKQLQGGKFVFLEK
ncbi:ABC-type branched-chain amino acid transport system, periplasmic component [Desulfosporosinus orientis DSM 765]|uniref:ABC-type branched-chain amino acid transport system, periplasmic component n=1 Tax=Desulfosporosinus orientis (strain ATCC 19365 / DSM 765 / NCIMB 8382 / VKM B-1628 / Singapore I) TaxID=768706 RepID=G7W9A8_DESOD|nr:ABC transporter substrate-binding protein [Desulfosporosinus orientis]AET69245.1 ABC-type branched-chain amino acid transport system, periplasmic component [Desulfosporosinus orientis DSM 765]